MISRVWRGWTARADADAYERLLRGTIFPGIQARGIAGYRGIQLFRRDAENEEVEFMTVMWFDSLAAVAQFAGNDHETAVVPAEARRLLARFDKRSLHYEVRESLVA